MKTTIMVGPEDEELKITKILRETSISKAKYMVLEIQFQSFKCGTVTWIRKKFEQLFSSKRYKEITVCRCKQTTSKNF